MRERVAGVESHRLAELALCLRAHAAVVIRQAQDGMVLTDTGRQPHGPLARGDGLAQPVGVDQDAREPGLI